jgi:hypothetical protein
MHSSLGVKGVAKPERALHLRSVTRDLTCVHWLPGIHRSKKFAEDLCTTGNVPTYVILEWHKTRAKGYGTPTG